MLARLCAEAQPSDAWVQAQATALLSPTRPGDWNEAVMDLGATLCTPKTPNCPACPLKAFCAAFKTGEPQSYPAPRKRTPVKAVQAAALLIGNAQEAYLEQRSGSLLGGLYGLPIEEGEGALERLLERLGAHSPRLLGSVQHQMTHRHITLHIYTAEAAVEHQDIATRPLSRLDHKALALLGQPAQQERLFWGERKTLVSFCGVQYCREYPQQGQQRQPDPQQRQNGSQAARRRRQAAVLVVRPALRAAGQGARHACPSTSA